MYMNNRIFKSSVILLFTLVLCVLSSCGKSEIKKSTQKQKDTIVELTGKIEYIEQSNIIVEGKQFSTSNIVVDESLEVNDVVALSYNAKKSKQTWIPLRTLKVVKRYEDEQIEALIAKMSLEEKVAQLLMVRCPKDGFQQLQSQYQFGGYIVFDANISPFTKEEFVANIQAIQNSSKIPVLIGVDEEGGDVIRFSRYLDYRSTPFLSPQQIYAQGGMQAIIEDTEEKSDLLKAIGVNMNFAPVADVSENPFDFIYSRTLGKDASLSAQYVQNVVQVMKQKQIGSVLKHFPGYGNNEDTHTGSSIDNRSLNSFQNRDFLTFQAGIEAGSDCVLVSHNIMASVDAQMPASLSLPVHKILREQLHFDGVIITDDLIMQAISDTYGDANAAVLAIQAGNDMIISSAYEIQYNAILDAVHNGNIALDQVDKSLFRILKMKYNLKLI